MNLTVFDLDETLLDGDSDVLWCDFLIAKGLLDGAEFSARNADMAQRYEAGSVGTQEFADFYVGTLAGRTALQWEPYRQEFLATQIVPRLPRSAIELVEQHLDAGDLVVMSTATNRFITELTALFLGIEHLIATEPEQGETGFSGRSCGTLNMRSGKVMRLHQWLLARGHKLGEFKSTAYSDSINDLPLLEAVDRAVVVNANAQLLEIAAARGWTALRLR
jgi:HAD superfamily hydrolase (TIGR01490 family)